jgi:hypothetical protein
MTEKKKKNKPRINPYWLYGMVIVLLLSISFFGDGGMQSTGKQIPQNLSATSTMETLKKW